MDKFEKILTMTSSVMRSNGDGRTLDLPLLDVNISFSVSCKSYLSWMNSRCFCSCKWYSYDGGGVLCITGVWNSEGTLDSDDNDIRSLLDLFC